MHGFSNVPVRLKILSSCKSAKACACLLVGAPICLCPKCVRTLWKSANAHACAHTRTEIQTHAKNNCLQKKKHIQKDILFPS